MPDGSVTPEISPEPDVSNWRKIGYYSPAVTAARLEYNRKQAIAAVADKVHIKSDSLALIIRDEIKSYIKVTEAVAAQGELIVDLTPEQVLERYRQVAKEYYSHYIEGEPNFPGPIEVYSRDLQCAFGHDPNQNVDVFINAITAVTAEIQGGKYANPPPVTSAS